jgi:phytanoyl-CoA dioxygenase PhyH
MGAADAQHDESVDGEQILDTIDRLSTANRSTRDADVERRLVELRRDACAGLPSPKRGRSWPRRVKDRFPGVVGPPEVTRDELTLELVRSAILRHGCLLVRGLLDPSRVEQLIESIDRAFAAHDAAARGAPVSETAPWFVPFEPPSTVPVPRQWVRDGGGVLAVDSPRALFDVIETFEEVGIGDLVTDYLGERPMILANKWTLRRVAISEFDLASGGPDWHQDGAFMGRDIRSINVWVALSDCGIDAPGIDIVARRFNDIVSTGTNGAHFDWSVGHATVERIAPRAIVRPVFNAGDALLFDHLLLHRTAIDERMRRDRYALEAWLAAPSSYPADQNPIAY